MPLSILYRPTPFSKMARYPRGPRYSTLVRLATPRNPKLDGAVAAQPDWDSHNVETPPATFRLPTALRGIKSLGLDALAKPRRVYKKFTRPPAGVLPDGTKKKPAVSRAALRYKTSEKIRMLAKPRAAVPSDARKNPFRVLRRALRAPRAKRLARLTQLAVPRLGLARKKLRCRT